MAVIAVGMPSDIHELASLKCHARACLVYYSLLASEIMFIKRPFPGLGNQCQVFYAGGRAQEKAFFDFSNVPKSLLSLIGK